ncbi:uncharacterized protein LOC135961314 [Calliphora vicina]|uniref:uncharacterized protein LOC135961314 n=1 Tax=Calliphora vicina TaxID=7373 RepID=UPI00325AAB41
MEPKTKVEYVVLKLTYSKSMHRQSCPQITVSRRKRSPRDSIPLVNDWFDRIMTQEKSSIPSTAKVRYCEWNITSGNEELFTANGHRFENMYFIMGKESVHTMFYMCEHINMEGRLSLTAHICRGCFNNEFEIVESVKGWLMERTGCN